MAGLEGIAPAAFRDPVEVVAVAGMLPPARGCVALPWRPWLCEAGSETAGPVSIAADDGVIPGSFAAVPVVGLIGSITREVSNPPWRKVEVLTTPPPQLLPQAMATSFRCWWGIQPTQFGP
jgi:hypothetical protein